MPFAPRDRGGWRYAGTTWEESCSLQGEPATIKAPTRAKAGSCSAAPPLAAKPFAVGVIAHLENRPHRQLEKRVRQGRSETPPAMRAGQHGCLRAFAGMTSVAIATATACVKFMQLNLWRAVSRYALRTIRAGCDDRFLPGRRRRGCPRAFGYRAAVEASAEPAFGPRVVDVVRAHVVASAMSNKNSMAAVSVQGWFES
jgi:hypothetical protein